jgi:nucleotide-binding universal stress UspA family protein
VSEAQTRIVVGVDGSPESEGALAFALEEAERTGDEVHVVTTWMDRPRVLSEPGVLEFGSPVTPEELHRRAETEQDRVVKAVVRDGSSVRVTGEVLEGAAGRLLVEASRGARMVVLGSRAIGPLRAALLGSVSRYVAERAACPVAVVPGRAREASAAGRAGA